MHQLLGIRDRPSKRLTDDLMSETYAKNGHLCVKTAHRLRTYAGIPWPSRPRRHDQRPRPHGLYFFHSDLIVAHYTDIGVHGAYKLINVIRKTVIIINQYNHIGLLLRLSALLPLPSLYFDILRILFQDHCPPQCLRRTERRPARFLHRQGGY